MADSKSSSTKTDAKTAGSSSAKAAAPAQTGDAAATPNEQLQANTPTVTNADVKAADKAGVNLGVAHATGVPGAAYVPQDGDRTAVEKVAAISAANDAAADPDQNLTLAEIAKDLAGVRRAIIDIANLLARSHNIDFLNEASVSDVLSGEAGLRGALATYGEHPHLVDDQVIPPGMNNPTGEVLPPNIPAGSVQQTDGSYKVPDGAPALTGA